MYIAGQVSRLKHIDFALLDLLVLQLSFIFGYFIRNGMHNPYAVELYRNMGVVLVFIDIICLFFLETLRNVLKKDYYVEFIDTLKNAAAVQLISVAYLFITKDAKSYSRLIVFYTSVIYLLTSYLSRMMLKKYLRSRNRYLKKRSVLVVSSQDIVAKAIKNLESAEEEDIDITGVVLTEDGLSYVNGIPVVSSLKDVADYVCHNWVDGVYIYVSSDNKIADDVVSQLEQTGVVLHFAIMEDLNKTERKQIVEKIGDSTVITTSMNYFTPQQAFLKRRIDIFGSLIGCFITTILTLIIGPMIFLSSPGPIFFRQTRIGKNDKKFKIYKFRSMHLNAERQKKELMKNNRIAGDFMFKMEFDPRIIGNKICRDGTVKKGLGHFLRETSIDEFPQFWNVLKGDMSLVGTRPPTVDEWERYSLHHRARMAIKPGITGLWQTSGRSNITDFEQVVEMDIKYINNWSVELDIKIIYDTIIAVLKRCGSM